MGQTDQTWILFVSERYDAADERKHDAQQQRQQNEAVRQLALHAALPASLSVFSNGNRWASRYAWSTMGYRKSAINDWREYRQIAANLFS